MRLLFFPLVVILLLSVCLRAQQDRYVTVIVIKANLRGTPSTTGSVVAEVRKDETLKLLEERCSWYLVQTSSYVGWLHGSTIRFSSAQRAGPSQSTRAVSPDIPNLRVPNPDSVAPEWLESGEDNGYDLVVNNYDGALLRGEPSEYPPLNEPLPPPIKRLKKGDQLVLLNRMKRRNWINVIDLDSGSEGWVYVSHVRIYYTRNPKSTVPVFRETRVDSDLEPEIIIKNDTNRLLTLRIGSTVYKIEGYTTRTLYLTSGTYKFYASVPRAYPLMGEKHWPKGVRYSWTFFLQ